MDGADASCSCFRLPVFFLQFRDGVVNTYDTLFKGTGGGGFTRETQFASKWGWYQPIYALAGGDIRRFDEITELNCHKCFTMLSFEKEKQELEASRIKNKF